jgi:hypothetical protein
LKKIFRLEPATLEENSEGKDPINICVIMCVEYVWCINDEIEKHLSKLF